MAQLRSLMPCMHCNTPSFACSGVSASPLRPPAPLESLHVNRLCVLLWLLRQGTAERAFLPRWAMMMVSLKISQLLGSHCLHVIEGWAMYFEVSFLAPFGLFVLPCCRHTRPTPLCLDWLAAAASLYQPPLDASQHISRRLSRTFFERNV